MTVKEIIRFDEDDTLELKLEEPIKIPVEEYEELKQLIKPNKELESKKIVINKSVLNNLREQYIQLTFPQIDASFLEEKTTMNSQGQEIPIPKYFAYHNQLMPTLNILFRKTHFEITTSLTNYFEKKAISTIIQNFDQRKIIQITGNERIVKYTKEEKKKYQNQPRVIELENLNLPAIEEINKDLNLRNLFSNIYVITKTKYLLPNIQDESQPKTAILIGLNSQKQMFYLGEINSLTKKDTDKRNHYTPAIYHELKKKEKEKPQTTTTEPLKIGTKTINNAKTIVSTITEEELKRIQRVFKRKKGKSFQKGVGRYLNDKIEERYPEVNLDFLEEQNYMRLSSGEIISLPAYTIYCSTNNDFTGDTYEIILTKKGVIATGSSELYSKLIEPANKHYKQLKQNNQSISDKLLRKIKVKKTAPKIVFEATISGMIPEKTIKKIIDAPFFMKYIITETKIADWNNPNREIKNAIIVGATTTYDNKEIYRLIDTFDMQPIKEYVKLKENKTEKPTPTTKEKQPYTTNFTGAR